MLQVWSLCCCGKNWNQCWKISITTPSTSAVVYCWLIHWCHQPVGCFLDWGNLPTIVSCWLHEMKLVFLLIIRRLFAQHLMMVSRRGGWGLFFMFWKNVFNIYSSRRTFLLWTLKYIPLCFYSLLYRTSFIKRQVFILILQIKKFISKVSFTSPDTANIHFENS